MANSSGELDAQSIGDITPESVVINLTGKAFKAVIDSSDETKRAIDMTPKAGFDLKLELIAEAEDMSTREKLDAINAAEDKYSADIYTNARTCRISSWARSGLVLLSLTGIVAIIAFTPGGRKAAGTVMKLIA